MTVVEKMAQAIYLAYANNPEARWELVDPRMQEGVWKSHARAGLTVLHDSFADPVVRAAIQAALDEKQK